SPCRAADNTAISFIKSATDEFLVGVTVAAGAATLLWAFIAARRLARSEFDARERARELEIKLNEAEAALTAEPHVLIVWRGRDCDPDRIVGDMRGIAIMPSDQRELMRFTAWLEPESASTLLESVTMLREQGSAFNIGIRTLPGELLEAEGR